MKRRAYLETTILSYLGARPSRSLIVAAVNEMDYLLTWNFTHINNAAQKSVIESVCRAEGYRCPAICTPEELMGDRS